MRLGLVKFINARPLDLAFRKSDSYQIIEDTPSRLFESLMEGRLDAALISSVECLRNTDRLNYCRTVGVCAKSEVTSILYLKKNKNSIPKRILSDTGSRTSIALLQILLYRKTGELLHFETAQPESIPSSVDENTAGLLIGDSALRYRNNPGDLYTVDLGNWWNEQEGLPFVFAMWAYPEEHPITDDFFENALNFGLKHMNEIIENSEFPDTKQYLTEKLHYRLGDADLKALDRFKALLLEAGLL